MSHALIGLLGDVGAGGDAYDDHPHDAVAPVAVGAAGLIAMLLLRSIAVRIGRSEQMDPVRLLAQRFGKMPMFGPVLAVTMGGFTTLLAMEFTEQLSSLGRIEGVADALGGKPVVGLGIVGCVAAAITVFGLRFASALLAATLSTVGALYHWIIAKRCAFLDKSAVQFRVNARRRHCTTSAIAVRSRGLRAPPKTMI